MYFVIELAKSALYPVAIHEYEILNNNITAQWP